MFKTSAIFVACILALACAQPVQETEDDLLDQLNSYVKSNDVDVTLPQGLSVLSGTQFKLSPRNIDNDELAVTVKLPASEEAKSVGEARKGKLKKILVPILIFVLLKAMTLIPLAIGVLGLKAWNALQLSFFSFVISVALAIFQLCKKIAADASSAQIHAPYDHHSAYYARGFASGDEQAHELAYRGHN